MTHEPETPAEQSMSELKNPWLALQARLRATKQALDEAVKDAQYHSGCRPNRRQAEAAMADAKAMNDRWADEVKARREAEAQRDALAAALREACRGLEDVAAQASLCVHHVGAASEEQRNWLRREVKREADWAIAKAQAALHALVAARSSHE